MPTRKKNTTGIAPTHRKSTRTLSWKTVRQVLILLRQCFKDALDREEITENPCDGITVEPKASSDQEWTFLTLEEIEAVRTCQGIPEAIRLLYTVAIYSGLRQGELWGLHWAEVRLEKRPQITVRFSHKGPPKNGKIRHVPLLAPAHEALVHLKKLAGKPQPDDLVFPALRGDYRRKSDDAGWGDRHHPRTKELEPGHKSLACITRRVRFHDLRHTCASHLVMGSWGTQWSLQEVAALLGHADVTVTQRYAHLSPDHLHRKAAETRGVEKQEETSARDHQEEAGSGPEVPGRNSLSPGFSAARPTRLELVTSRSVGVKVTQELREVRPPQDHGRTTALSLLSAVAAREPAGELVEALVASVLGDERVQLALAVQSAEPRFRLRRALELAALVLDEAEAEGQRGVK